MTAEETKLLHLLTEEYQLVARGEEDELAVLGAGQRLLDILKTVLSKIDIRSLTKDQFMAVVGTAFDSLIAPMFSGSAALVLPLVRSVVLSLAEQYYDRLVTGT